MFLKFIKGYTEAKIAYFYFNFFVLVLRIFEYKNVFGFHVSVNNLLIMDLHQSMSDLPDDSANELTRKIGGEHLEQFVKITCGAQLHDQINKCGRFIYII